MPEVLDQEESTETWNPADSGANKVEFDPSKIGAKKVPTLDGQEQWWKNAKPYKSDEKITIGPMEGGTKEDRESFDQWSSEVNKHQNFKQEAEKHSSNVIEYNKLESDKKDKATQSLLESKAKASSDLATASYPNVRSAYKQFLFGTAAPIVRLWNSDMADRMNRLSGAYEEEAPAKGMLAKAGRAVTAGLPSQMLAGYFTGPTGMIAMNAGQSADQAITSGRDAGLSGTELTTHAVSQGAIIGGVMGLAQKIGMPGIVRGMFGGEQAIETGISSALKSIGKSMTEQEVQMLTASFGQSLENAISGVDPSALDTDKLAKTAASVTLQTLIQGGLIGTPELIRAHLNATKARIVDMAKNEETPTRTQWTKDLGLDSKYGRSKSERKRRIQDIAKEITPEIIEEPLAKNIPEQYGIKESFVNGLKNESLALSKPTGETLETLYPSEGDKPAIVGEELGNVNGKRVMAVEPESVNRRLFDDPEKPDFGEFTSGGTKSRYKEIPEDQIWVSRSSTNKELPKFALHEALEDHLMSEHGLSYSGKKDEHPEGAHDIATKVEQDWARNSEGGDVNIPKQEGDIREPQPTQKAIRPSAAKRFVQGVIGIISPQSIGGDITREAIHILRRGEGESAQMKEVTEANLSGLEDEFDRMSKEDRNKFKFKMDDPKHEGPQESLRLEAVAKQLQNETNRLWSEVQKRRGSEEFIENYFSRNFKATPESDAIIGGLIKKTFRKSGFLKHRKYPTLREALAAGLEEVDDNPIRATINKCGQMAEWIAKTDDKQKLIHEGIPVFVPQSVENNYMPNGYRFTNDPTWVVKTSGDITLQEHYDKLTKDVLDGVAANLGTKTSRVKQGSLGKGVLGVSKSATGGRGGTIEVVRGSTLGTLAHEIGHQIGDIFGLYEYIQEQDRNSPNLNLEEEMTKLAALRHEGIPATDIFKGYVQDPSEREAVLLQAWLDAPDKMERDAPNITKIWKEFLQANEQLRPLLTLDRSLVIGTEDYTIKQPGERVLGRWAFPNSVADILDNQLSNGLRSNSNYAIRSGYQLARKYGNAINMSTLALSAKHAYMVMKQAASSQAQIGIQEMLRPGQRIQGAKDFLTSPLALIKAIKVGRETRAAMQQTIDSIDNPVLRNQVEDIVTAGGRRSMQKRFQNDSRKALKKSFNDLRESEGWSKIPVALKMPVNAFFASLEAVASPIMEHLVPIIKVGSFVQQAADLHARATEQGLSDFQINEQLVQKWDSIENRMGEMNLDNKFWNKYLQDSAQLTIRSTGWNVGTITEFFGAATDIPTTKARIARGGEVISDKMAYVIADVAGTALVGSILTYCFTGHGPQSLKDTVYVPTGNKDKNGNDERISMGEYINDIISWGFQPIKTLVNKSNPMWGSFAEMYRNQDFYGEKIRNEDDPRLKRFGDTLLHLVKSWEPYSIANFSRMREENATAGKSFLVGALGMHEAPAYITKSKAMLLADEYQKDRMPSGSRTHEEVEQSKRRKKIVDTMRKGNEPSDEDWGALTSEQQSLSTTESQLTPLQAKVFHLSLKQSLDVYKVSNEKEKEELRPLLEAKGSRMKVMSKSLYDDYKETLGL